MIGKNLQSSNKYELNYEKLRLGRVDMWVSNELNAYYLVRQAAYGAETTIWRADPFTGERVRLFFGDTTAVFGRVSRDGRWMALSTERAGVYGIQTLAMDRSGLVWRVSDSGDPRFSSVVWADGGRMLFLERQGSYAAPETISWDLWELDLDHDEQLVALALADHADDRGLSCYPSRAYLGWKTGYS